MLRLQRWLDPIAQKKRESEIDANLSKLYQRNTDTSLKTVLKHYVRPLRSARTI